MKFTLTTVVALFAAQALASAIAEPVADHDDHDVVHKKFCHPETVTKTVTEFKWKHPKTKTETETETKTKTVYRHKKIWKTTTVYKTTTKKWCPKKWEH